MVLTMNTTQLLLQTEVHDSKCMSMRKGRSFQSLNHTWVDKNIRSVTECLVASEKYTTSIGQLNINLLPIRTELKKHTLTSMAEYTPEQLIAPCRIIWAIKVGRNPTTHFILLKLQILSYF